MQSLNLFLTQHFLFLESADPNIDSRLIGFSEPQFELPFDLIASHLEDLDIPRHAGLNVLLGQQFLNYYHFTLPPMSRRKIDKVLLFELADTLIFEVEDYFFDYRHRVDRDLETKLGVYTISRETVQQFTQITKRVGLEIKSIVPLNDLFDIYFKSRLQPENSIVVAGDNREVRLFTYRSGFLIGFSSIELSRFYQFNTPASNSESVKTTVEQAINQKIKTIFSQENQIDTVQVEGTAEQVFHADDDGHLHINEFLPDVTNESRIEELKKASALSRTGRINLLKTEFFLLQEAKRNLKKIMVTVVCLILGFGLYLGTLVYENIENSRQYAQLEQVFTATINKYLPKGTSKSNALAILREQVNELKALKKKTEKFSARDYTVSRQLKELSLAKGVAPSLTINRYFMTDQSIRIQGEVASFAEYDRLKERLTAIFPEDKYSMTYNQKSSGEALIQFTVTIRMIDQS